MSALPVKPVHDEGVVQVVFRTNEYCERCGARNPFRKRRTINVDGERMQYAQCRSCGAAARIYWRDPEG